MTPFTIEPVRTHRAQLLAEAVVSAYIDELARPASRRPAARGRRAEERRPHHGRSLVAQRVSAA